MPPRRAPGPVPTPKTDYVYNCRFKRLGKGNWIETEFLRRLDDDTIELIDPHSGGIKTLFPKYVEFKTRGPRGGTKWVPATEQDGPDGP